MPSNERTSARLVLRRPDGEPLVYTLDEGRSITLGRDAGNTIVLASRFVSKRHALMSWTPHGVRIEDQDSVNGITINGQTVHAAQLSPGDVVQIGDQHFVFEDTGSPDAAPLPGTAAPGAGARTSRLVPAALLTMLAMVGGLAVIYVKFLAPTVGPSAPRADAGAAGVQAAAAAAGTALREASSLPPDTTITPFDSPQAQAIVQRAVATKNSRPADVLFDQGQLAYENGRLLDAYRLLHGALLRDAHHDASRRLLLRVMRERELRLDSLKAVAAQADQARKFDEATRQWEAVQALTLDDEPLHAHARTELARLRQRAAQ